MNWAIWLIVGLALLLLEMLGPGFICLWFAVAAFVVAVLYFVGLHALWLQLLVFCVISLPLVLASRTIFKKYFMRASPGAQVKMNVQSLPGKIGTVCLEIDNARDQGQVMLQGMEWMARSAGGQPIAAGARVRVVEVIGIKLMVVPEQGGE